VVPIRIWDDRILIVASIQVSRECQLLEIVDATNAVAFSLALLQCRQKHRRQYGDNGDHTRVQSSKRLVVQDCLSGTRSGWFIGYYQGRLRDLNPGLAFDS